MVGHIINKIVMKKLIAFALVLLAVSCATERNTLNSEQMSHWSNRNDTLFYNRVPAAVFVGYELEIYKGEVSQEICIEQINDEAPLDSIVYYVHTLHHNDKVQVVSTYGKDKLKYRK